MSWQPIETAPMDGTPFLAFVKYPHNLGTVFVVMHFDDIGRLLVSWDHDNEFSPTHWMPLPEAPDAP